LVNLWQVSQLASVFDLPFDDDDDEWKQESSAEDSDEEGYSSWSYKDTAD